MEEPQPFIRRYQSADHQALRDFLLAVFIQMGRRFLPDGKDSDIRDLDSVYLQNQGAFHVVDLGRAIRGSVGVRPFAPGIAELKRLYLSASLRSRGLGEALCLAAINDARRFGYRLLRLDTSSESVEALGLFRKLGFYEIDKYSDNPYAGIFFEKSL